MEHVDELVRVALPDGEVRGVVYAVDPELAWVSVLTPNNRLLLVRESLVTYTGVRAEKRAELPAETPDAAPRCADVHELAREFNRRNMQARVQDDTLLLLDGAVRIAPPYNARSIATANETVQARVTAVLREIEVAAVHAHAQ